MAFAAAAAHDARLPGNRPPCSSRERAFAPDAGSDTAAVWRRGLRRRPFLACHRLSNIARGPVPDLAAWQPLLSAAAQRPDHRLGSGSAFGSCGTRARACEGVLVSCGPGRARMQTLSAACVEHCLLAARFRAAVARWAVVGLRLQCCNARGWQGLLLRHWVCGSGDLIAGRVDPSFISTASRVGRGCGCYSWFWWQH